MRAYLVQRIDRKVTRFLLLQDDPRVQPDSVFGFWIDFA
jgi:hypothetical protein